MKFAKPYMFGAIDDDIQKDGPFDFIVQQSASNALAPCVITDVETGVQYLEIDCRLTPRINPDGTVRVVDGKKLRKECEAALLKETGRSHVYETRFLRDF